MSETYGIIQPPTGPMFFTLMPVSQLIQDPPRNDDGSATVLPTPADVYERKDVARLVTGLMHIVYTLLDNTPRDEVTRETNIRVALTAREQIARVEIEVVNEETEDPDVVLAGGFEIEEWPIDGTEDADTVLVGGGQ